MPKLKIYKKVGKKTILLLNLRPFDYADLCRRASYRMKLVQVDTRRFSKTALGKLTENQQKALKHIQCIYFKAFQRGARNGQEILGLPNGFDAKMVDS